MILTNRKDNNREVMKKKIAYSITCAKLTQMLLGTAIGNSPIILVAEPRTLPQFEVAYQVQDIGNTLEESLPVEDSQELKETSEEMAVEEEIEVEVVEEPQIDPDMFFWLSHVIMAEEEGACYLNKLLCGLVVINRINDNEFPDSIQEVIFAPGQYASATDGRIWLEPSEEVIKATTEILSGNCSVSLPDDVVYQSEQPLGSGVYLHVENQYYSRK